MIPVQSTNVRDVGYDAASHELWVRFLKDPSIVYVYVRVPSSVYHGLLRSGSKGGYLADFVKPCYGFRRAWWRQAA